MKRYEKNTAQLSRLPAVGLIALALALAACSHDELQTPQEENPPELVFSVSGLSRATANYPIADYFGTDGSPYVDVVAGNITASYEYRDGLLECVSDDNKITFPGVNSPLPKVDLTWPAEYEYKADQSEKKNFLASDRLVCGFTNLMPSNRVAVLFDHANYKLTFTAVRNNDGLKIASLSVDDGQGLTYHAFCDGDNAEGFAQLVLPAGVSLSGKQGSLTISGDQDAYVFTVENYSVPQVINRNITVNITLK